MVTTFTGTGPAVTTLVVTVGGETTKTIATTTATPTNSEPSGNSNSGTVETVATSTNSEPSGNSNSGTVETAATSTSSEPSGNSNSGTVETAATSTNSEPSGNSTSGFFANRVAVIGTFLAVGIVIIAVIVFLLLFVYRRKTRKRSVSGSEIGVQPFDLPPGYVSSSIPEGAGHSSSSLRPFGLKYNQSTIEPANQATPSSSVRQALELNSTSAPQNPEPSPSPLSHPNSSHSTIQTTSAPTVRQMHLQQEANDLHQQVRELQQTVNASNAGVQAAMARILGHIQALEVQFNSDWARGLTDEQPPTYTTVDSMTNA
ncbi:hypothetical protein D9758_017545 [Tetrapyrgos nigripes]|uniref:Uncharacterized protein n=1 Tax=Tetrapyrgos nigripes TaxID=182062 RepID=A0A8H5C851_9AGAR|nr:hypothetical protein D9758_017545 [Tetrapyrgos nigripes]